MVNPFSNNARNHREANGLANSRPPSGGYVPAMKTAEFFSTFWSDNGYRFCSCWYEIGYGFQGNHEMVLRICLWSEIVSAFGQPKGTTTPSYPSPPPPPPPPP